MPSLCSIHRLPRRRLPRCRSISKAMAVTATNLDQLYGQLEDLLMRPGWCWHGHGNDGGQPAYWLDYLDVPLVQYMEPMFFEPYPGEFQEPESVSRDSPYVFPLEDTLVRLDATEPDPDGYFGRRV